MIAIIEAVKRGSLNKKYWSKNIVAGVVVGIVALPLAMAFAIASGVSPEAGIYTSILAGIIVSLFGGSQVQIAGPTGAFIVLLSSILGSHGLEGLQIATIMAGAMLMLMSIAKLGSVIRFIPAPVIMGFTAGIGVTIWIGQWPYFFGFGEIGQTDFFHEKMLLMLQALPHSHIPTLGVALLSLVIVLFAPKVPGVRVIPSPLLAMLAATLTQWGVGFDNVATIGSTFGGIPTGLPQLTLPDITIDKVIALIGPAFTIAMLGAIESLLSAVVADGMNGKKHDSNAELMGQGIANIVVPFFGGIAATGAIARTATNIRQGGDSPLAGIVHAIFLIGVILFLAPLAVYIPLASLAAILFVVSYNMSDVKRFVRLIRVAPLADSMILLLTFFLTIFTDLVVAVNVGVILAILQFMRKMIDSIDVHKSTGEEISQALQAEINLHPEIVVYTIEGPLFFGAINAFEGALAHINKYPTCLIIRFSKVPFVDLTGLKMLNEIIKNLQSKGVHVFVSEAKPDIRRHMYRAGLFRTLGRSYLWRNFETTLYKAENKIKNN